MKKLKKSELMQLIREEIKSIIENKLTVTVIEHRGKFERFLKWTDAEAYLSKFGLEFGNTVPGGKESIYRNKKNNDFAVMSWETINA